MPLIHLPIQSGSNKILKAMNRKHTIEDYLRLVEKLKKINPLIKFSSDFIIGYPGENEKDFDKSLELVKKVKFINTYSFIFSPRPGTPAAKLKLLDVKEAKRRLEIFQKISNEIKVIYRKNLFNKKSLVLFENKMENKKEYFGRDEFSNAVIVKSNEDLSGKTKKVIIIKGNQTTLFGKLDNVTQKKDQAA